MNRFIAGLLLALTTFVVYPTSAYASSSLDWDISGMIQNLYCEIAYYMASYIGVLIGVCVVLYGFFVFIMTGTYKSFVIIAVGAMIPSFPSIYAGISEFTANIFPETRGTVQAGLTAKALNNKCQTFTSSTLQMAYTGGAQDDKTEGTVMLEHQKENIDTEVKKALKYTAECYPTLAIDGGVCPAK